MNMERRRRLRRHRSALYEDRRGKMLPWLILAAAVLIAAVVAVILGNVLGKQVEGLPPAGGNVTVTEGRVPVPRLTADAFALGYDISNMKANGTTAVSVVLRDGNDSLTYRSETAIHMKRQTDGAVAVSAADEIAYLHENEIYVCGVFTALSGRMSGQARTAEEYYERSLLAEIAGNGIDAVLIDGLSFAEDDADASLAYLTSLHSAAPDTAIGVVLPPDVFRESGSESRLRAYLKSVDFFVMDLRGVTDTDLLTDIIKDCTYCLCAFPVRLFLNRADTDIRAWLENAGYTNLQIMP